MKMAASGHATPQVLPRTHRRLDTRTMCQPQQASRRAILWAGSALLPTLLHTSAGQAKKIPKPYTDASVLDEATSATEFTPYVSPTFQLQVPARWSATPGLDTSPEASVLGSWFNPFCPGAETLAVYRRAVPGARRTADLGTPEELGQALASVAPNSVLLDVFRYQDDKEQEYFVQVVEFDGAAAGRFGAAVELRTVAVASDGTQFTQRITTTRYRWLAYSEVQQELMTVVKSFQLL